MASGKPRKKKIAKSPRKRPGKKLPKPKDMGRDGAGFTEAEYLEIGRTIAGTAQNVYTLVRNRYDREFRDEHWKELEKTAKVFRCEECSIWLPDGDRDGDICGMCAECVDRMNGVDAEDD